MAEYEYQKSGRYFAQTPGELEPLAAAELESLGAVQAAPAVRGVEFAADRKTLYRITYQARLISRVLAPLAVFPCRNRDDLYRAGLSVNWQAIFSPEDAFAIFSNVSHNPGIRHSGFASQCLKDAVADYFRKKCGCRPSVDLKNPRLWINLHIENNRGTIGLDCSGGSLHRRGYRKKTVAAPMQEILAAAVVKISGWDGAKPLYDPMCGSGTLLSEALMAYCRIPAGYFREELGFFFLPDFKKNVWKSVKQQADGGMRDLPAGLVSGSDADGQAYDATVANLSQIPGGDGARISRRRFADIAGLENRVILCNPPYGIRLASDADLGVLYKTFGDFLKRRCRGSDAYIYFGNREMIKRIGLKPSWKKPLRNAGLDGRLVKYELY